MNILDIADRYRYPEIFKRIIQRLSTDDANNFCLSLNVVLTKSEKDLYMKYSCFDYGVTYTVAYNAYTTAYTNTLYDKRLTAAIEQDINKYARVQEDTYTASLLDGGKYFNKSSFNVVSQSSLWTVKASIIRDLVKDPFAPDGNPYLLKMMIQYTNLQSTQAEIVYESVASNYIQCSIESTINEFIRQLKCILYTDA